MNYLVLAWIFIGILAFIAFMLYFAGYGIQKNRERRCRKHPNGADTCDGVCVQDSLDSTVNIRSTSVIASRASISQTQDENVAPVSVRLSKVSTGNTQRNFNNNDMIDIAPAPVQRTQRNSVLRTSKSIAAETALNNLNKSDAQISNSQQLNETANISVDNDDGINNFRKQGNTQLKRSSTVTSNEESDKDNALVESEQPLIPAKRKSLLTKALSENIDRKSYKSGSTTSSSLSSQMSLEENESCERQPAVSARRSLFRKSGHQSLADSNRSSEEQTQLNIIVPVVRESTISPAELSKSRLSKIREDEV